MNYQNEKLPASDPGHVRPFIRFLCGFLAVCALLALISLVGQIATGKFEISDVKFNPNTIGTLLFMPPFVIGSAWIAWKGRAPDWMVDWLDR